MGDTTYSNPSSTILYEFEGQAGTSATVSLQNFCLKNLVEWNSPWPVPTIRQRHPLHYIVQDLWKKTKPVPSELSLPLQLHTRNLTYTQPCMSPRSSVLLSASSSGISTDQSQESVDGVEFYSDASFGMDFTEWIAGGLLLLSLYLSNGDIGEIGVTGLRTRTLNADLRSPQNWTATFALRFAPHSLPPHPHWVRVGVRRRYYTLSGHQRQTHSAYAFSWAELYQRVETFCSVPGPISSSASAAHVHDAAKMHAHRLHRRTGVLPDPHTHASIDPEGSWSYALDNHLPYLHLHEHDAHG